MFNKHQVEILFLFSCIQLCNAWCLQNTQTCLKSCKVFSVRLAILWTVAIMGFKSPFTFVNYRHKVPPAENYVIVQTTIVNLLKLDRKSQMKVVLNITLLKATSQQNQLKTHLQLILVN